MSATGDLLDGRYRLGVLLGRGGMSDVFRSVDEVNSTEVAIKVVRSSDPEYARRLAQEAQALRRFHHPGLVQLYESGVNGDMAYLVMEFIDGASLAATLRDGPLTAPETASLGAAVAGALAYVHAQGVVHRDVKPANILIGSDGQARLTDFGIARLVDTSTLTLTGTMLGTATYMAPEQLDDHAVGPSADVWSLGIVLLECLTGERVYDGTPSEVIARRLAGPVPLPEGLPVPWRLLFNGTLALTPDQRLSAAEVQAMLSTPAFHTPWVRTDPSTLGDLPTTITGADAQAGETMVRPPVSMTSRGGSGTWWSRNARWTLVVAAVVLIAAIGLAFGLSSHHTPPSTTTTSTVATTTTTVPTTTTTLPSIAHSLTKLVNDVLAGQSAGHVGPNVAQAITGGAQQAVSDASAGDAATAATDLQQVATAIATGLSSGYISPQEATVLQSDLSSLANSLGLGAAATPGSTTSTTTSTTLPPGGGGGAGAI